MANLLIFNPDTDYALASGSDFYTPPAIVRKLACEKAGIALAWSEPGDFLLLPPEFPATEELGATDRKVRLLRSEQPFDSDFWGGIGEIKPWGWNRALRQRLLGLGAPESVIPSVEWVDALRSLSHRRTTIAFNKLLGAEEMPVELQSEEEAVLFMRQNPGCWFKAPWSSSGRGVVCSANMNEEQVRQWCRGICRRQGSVMAETDARRIVDFATEWNIRKSDGQVEFLGLSMFTTTNRGKYAGNLKASQMEIEQRLTDLCGSEWKRWLERQALALENLIAPHYQGPLGIDMTADSQGGVRPCIELNLRRTMGHVALRECR